MSTTLCYPSLEEESDGAPCLGINQFCITTWRIVLPSRAVVHRHIYRQVQMNATEEFAHDPHLLALRGELEPLN